jgi:uncharacterized protein YqgV (UPF0045/DUF77 family)
MIAFGPVPSRRLGEGSGDGAKVKVEIVRARSSVDFLRRVVALAGSVADEHCTGRVGTRLAIRWHATCPSVLVMNTEAEVSLYPLTEVNLEHPVHDFARVLETHGCTVVVGPMSSIVKGESSAVFEALRIGYEEAARKSGCLLIIKACNVCPL